MFFQQALLDAPNVVVCQPSASSRLLGECRVIVTSRHLREPSHVRLPPAPNGLEVNSTNIFVFSMLFIPRVGVTVRHAADTYTLAAYVSGLRSYVEDVRVEEAFPPSDIDRLFDGTEALMALARETTTEAERAEFRAALAEARASMLRDLRTEAHALSVNHLVRTHLQRSQSANKGQSRAASDWFRRADAGRRFLPAVPIDSAKPALGRFDVPGTKLGEVKRLLFHAFAVMLGVLKPTDEQDLRTKRVNTPEMVVANVVRQAVIGEIHNGIGACSNIFNKEEIKDAFRSKAFNTQTYQNNMMAMPMEQRTPATTGDQVTDQRRRVKYPFETAPDSRRSFLNFLQKLFMIHVPHNPGSNPVKRLVHPSHVGRICYSDTPTTAEIGLRLAVSVGALISPDVSALLVRQRLPLDAAGGAPVFVNGVHVGATADPRALREAVRQLRRTPVQGRLKRWLFLALGVHVERTLWHAPEGRPRFVDAVFVRSDWGRFYRPLVCLERLRAVGAEADFFTLIERGVVEFVDTDEELCPSAVVLAPALWEATARHTHSELHPCLLHGVLTSLIPYAAHNHGVKNTNMCNHLKAVMHKHSLGYATRMDSQSYMAWNLQTPLVRTPGFDWLELGRRPHGANVLFAICTREGYNQEVGLGTAFPAPSPNFACFTLYHSFS